MDKFKKFSVHFIFGFFILFIGYFLGFWANFYYLSYKLDPVRLSNKQALNDIHGGKTPEETYNLFVLALKQGNLELASKYFILGKQSEKLDEFKKIKEKGEMEKYINDLPEWGGMKELNTFEDGRVKEFGRDVWREKETFEFQGKQFESPSGFYTLTTSFRINIKTNVWKIEQL